MRRQTGELARERLGNQIRVFVSSALVEILKDKDTPVAAMQEMGLAWCRFRRNWIHSWTFLVSNFVKMRRPPPLAPEGDEE